MTYRWIRAVWKQDAGDFTLTAQYPHRLCLCAHFPPCTACHARLRNLDPRQPYGGLGAGVLRERATAKLAGGLYGGGSGDPEGPHGDPSVRRAERPGCLRASFQQSVSPGEPTGRRSSEGQDAKCSQVDVQVGRWAADLDFGIR